MDDPTTKPSGSKPASPSSTYSETDRSEVNTPAGLAPAVCASLLSAACGSQLAAAPDGLAKRGMGSPFGGARGLRGLRMRSLPAGCAVYRPDAQRVLGPQRVLAGPRPGRTRRKMTIPRGGRAFWLAHPATLRQGAGKPMDAASLGAGALQCDIHRGRGGRRRASTGPPGTAGAGAGKPMDASRARIACHGFRNDACKGTLDAVSGQSENEQNPDWNRFQN